MKLRLWPGVLLAAILLFFAFVRPLIMPDAGLMFIVAPLALGVLIVLWWLFFSRAPWTDRIVAVLVMLAAGYASLFVVHPSIRGGYMGRMVPFFFAIPFLPVAIVAWAAGTRRMPPARRRVWLVATALLAMGSFSLVRTEGVRGGAADLKWRWTPTAEDRLLAQTQETPAAPDKAADVTLPAAPATATTAALEPSANPEKPAVPPPVKMDAPWPGFRGSERNSVVHGTQIPTDWEATPPTELWRRPIGPGWSSFAVAGDLLLTQEQRGDNEIVAAYRASNGKPVWMHKEPVRFYESNGGAGPRSTPTFNGGRVYAMGATGILNALDAATGVTIWKRETVTDAGIKLPGWGITSSPLVIDDVVVVAVSGALLAYDRESGEKRWFVKSSGGSYSSPHLVTVDGVKQVLLLAGSGLTSVSPTDGTVLWRSAFAGVPIVQPAVIGDRDILFTSSDAMGGLGARRLAVSHNGGNWKVEERWTSNTLKPYFNDYVIHNGHAYGFDGNILACIDLADGTRKWKGGRYGNGQLVLLADQDLLLVISEEGELALVSATPERFNEVAAKRPAIEGKTWNHPVIVGDRLFVRNGQEMAAFSLGGADRRR
jgi:outer membrane protein assembly factor BamB